MQSAQVLDVVERLFNAAEHPDIVAVERYGRDVQPGGQSPAGVAVTYQSGAQAYLWADEPGRPAPEPCPLPDEMPELKFRALPALKLLVELLDVARPAVFTAWRTVAFNGLGLKPSGLELRCADGSTAYLRATSGSGPTHEPTTPQHTDYAIPEGVKTCLAPA